MKEQQDDCSQLANCSQQLDIANSFFLVFCCCVATRSSSALYHQPVLVHSHFSLLLGTKKKSCGNKKSCKKREFHLTIKSLSHIIGYFQKDSNMFSLFRVQHVTLLVFTSYLHSVWPIPVLPGEETWPLVILSHHWGRRFSILLLLLFADTVQYWCGINPPLIREAELIRKRLISGVFFSVEGRFLIRAIWPLPLMYPASQPV